MATKQLSAVEEGRCTTPQMDASPPSNRSRLYVSGAILLSVGCVYMSEMIPGFGSTAASDNSRRLGECTPCDDADGPVDGTSVLFCQPGMQSGGCKGHYMDRSDAVKEPNDLCSIIENDECFTLNDLKCDDGTLCLKWGGDPYVGAVLLPAGLNIEAFHHWGCQSPPKFPNTASGGDSGSKWEFWDHHNRVDAFQFSLMDGYYCEHNMIKKSDPPSQPAHFKNYVGKWENIGTGITATQSATLSWSDQTSKETSDSFSAGVKVGVETEVGVIFAKAKVSAEVSTSFSDSSSKTLSQMTGGSTSFTCTSAVDCSDGNLFQWKLTADMVVGEDVTPQYLEECKFVCVPSAMPGLTKPRCPPQFCNDLKGCQCCNGNYEKDGSTPPCFGSTCDSSVACPDPEDEVLEFLQ